MKTQATIQKWGNGLALRVSGVMRDIPHFEEGTKVDVDINEKGFTVIKSVSPKKFIFPFKESQLIAGLTPEKVHADLLATPLPSEIIE